MQKGIKCTSIKDVFEHFCAVLGKKFAKTDKTSWQNV
jgi:hypothetical protein